METYHEGPLPEKDSYFSVEADNVILEALKRAEDGDGLILRKPARIRGAGIKGRSARRSGFPLSRE